MLMVPKFLSPFKLHPHIYIFYIIYFGQDNSTKRSTVIFFLELTLLWEHSPSPLPTHTHTHTHTHMHTHTHTHPHTHLRSSLMAYHPLEVSFDFMSPYFSSMLSLLCAGPCSKHFVLINTFNLFQIPIKYILLLPHFMIRN